MTALILVGLIPFAALGILFGHLLTPDSIGPALGGMTAALSILGGVWFPISQHGVMHDIAQVLPVVLARPGRAHRRRRQRLGRDGLGRRRSLDARRRVLRAPRVRARHEAHVVRGI